MSERIQEKKTTACRGEGVYIRPRVDEAERKMDLAGSQQAKGSSRRPSICPIQKAR